MMTQRVSRLLVALPLLGACASGSVTPGSDMAVRTSAVSGLASNGMAVSTVSSESAVAVDIGAAPAAVFDALPAVYDMLAVPRSKVDREAKLMGAEGLKARRVLGSRQLRSLFDCGGTPGMPNAETYDLYITIMSRVSAKGTGSTVYTSVTATATPSQFGGGAAVNCSSNGVIEDELSKALRARFGS
jgi:hypothetical protein